MPEVIATFQSRKNPEAKTAPTQIPNTFSIEDMERLLNTILEQDKAYAFFIGEKQLLKGASEIVSQPEETVNVEYLTVARLTTENALVEADSIITCISIRWNPKTETDSVVVCTLDGTVKEFSLTPGMEEISTFEAHTPIRAVSSSEYGVYITTVTNKVVSVGDEKIVLEDESPIRTICAKENILCVGLDSGVLVVLRENKEVKRLDVKEAIGKVIVREHDGSTYIIAGTLGGAVHVFDEETWKHTQIDLPRPITALGYCDGKIYAGSVGGQIYISSLQGIEREVQSDESFISRIEAGTVFVGYANENRVLLRDKETFTGTHKLVLANILSDMKISSKQLFVTDQNFLRIFNVFDE